MTIAAFGTTLLPSGWVKGARLEVDERGRIAAVAEGSAGGEDIVLPGMPNLHSHSFQRAMAGLVETAGPGKDSFWTWRELMYRFVELFGPEDIEAIASQAFAEMLSAGYTSVAEFHYLHHAPDGRPYAARTELSDRIVAAARRTGIRLTLLPVFYAAGGFGGAPPSERQRRFLNDAEGFLSLVEDLQASYGDDPLIRIGIAPHSLRAAPPDALAEVVREARRMDPEMPIHIHIAEQRKEVEDCLAWSAARPVDWLFDHHEVDRHWCLIHATHMTAGETRRFAHSGAVAGLCPTTEANLGDGLFPAPSFLKQRGMIGVGSDSNVTIDPAEELRLLEYGQRLILRRRNVLAEGEGRSTGAAIHSAALRGGAAALGQPIGALSPGCYADFITLDGKAPTLAGASGDALLDAWIFSGGKSLVKSVTVGGREVVRGGRHIEGEAIAERYRKTLKKALNTR